MVMVKPIEFSTLMCPALASFKTCGLTPRVSTTPEADTGHCHTCSQLLHSITDTQSEKGSLQRGCKVVLQPLTIVADSFSQTITSCVMFALSPAY
ncbi:hypothetical protein Plhal304r1_c005g0022331 [Plasmopara halstedii]